MKKEDLIKLKEKISELSEHEKKLRDLYSRNISIGNLYGPMTGYASIDKPWLKYYKKENIGIERINCNAYEFMKQHNIDNLSANAINYMGKIITYEELLNEIDKTTKSLIKLGIGSGDIVTLVMANIPENVYLFYALNRLGAVANIIDPRLKDDEMLEIINDTKSKHLISIDTIIKSNTIKKIKEKTEVKSLILVNPMESLELNKFIKFISSFKKKIKLNKFKDCITSWNNFIINGQNISLENVSTSDENTKAVMVRTGGTTGRPKTVILTNKNLNEMANQHELGDYNFNKKDKFLNFLPPFIAYGICGATHMPLVLGLEDILIPKFDAKIFPKLMKKYSPNVVFGGPILYEKMMINKKTKNIDLSGFKVPVSGGDTMDIELERKINKYFKKNNCNHPVGQGYGMTEVSSSVCYSKENSYTEGSVGIPLINNSIAIFDVNTNEELTYNQEGEICIKTDTTMYGYLNNEEEYRKVIRTHDDGSIWVHTGDIGRISNNGNLFVVGRIKRMIVSNGSKIFPTTIENIISRNQQVLSCTVVGAKHKNLRTVPVAHIVLKEKNVNLEKLVSELNYEIKKELPDYYLPYTYVFRKEMPLTSINKVDYKKLENEIYSSTKRIVSEKNKTKKLIRRRS